MDNIELLFNAPILSVQLLLDGVLIGAIFALAAYGMALVWGVMNIINIAQGEFVMLGGYTAFFCTLLESIRCSVSHSRPCCCSFSVGFSMKA
jgi:branched-subunit amino acid ABC-type transport system permease component